ncbi:MAG: cryptic plasmid protein A [Fimbriimonadales bacterium]|nr:cryptic plasmid protein A [Fimbriimonadales bacterium]
MEPLITNERAQREWAWICAHVGETTAREAIAKLPGARKPYPLNVARVLGLSLPRELAKDPPAPPEVARLHLERARALLKKA